MDFSDINIWSKGMSYNVGLFVSGVSDTFGSSIGNAVADYLESINALSFIGSWQVAMLGTKFSRVEGFDLYMLGFMGGEFVDIG